MALITEVVVALVAPETQPVLHLRRRPVADVAGPDLSRRPVAGVALRDMRVRATRRCTSVRSRDRARSCSPSRSGASAASAAAGG
eukprot:7453513-Alexandrium_andersonii.AAC.1